MIEPAKKADGQGKRIEVWPISRLKPHPRQDLNFRLYSKETGRICEQSATGWRISW